jgi:hypothetical protein
LANAARVAAAESGKNERQNRADAEKQLEILRARAAGDQKQADAMQREMQLRQEARRIADEQNISFKSALDQARERLALEEKINGKAGGGGEGGEGGRRKITGLNAEVYDRAMAKWNNSGIDSFYRAQQRNADGSRAIPVGKLFDAEQRRAAQGGEAGLLSEIKDVLGGVKGELERINAE